jgi:hypothetical protein
MGKSGELLRRDLWTDAYDWWNEKYGKMEVIDGLGLKMPKLEQLATWESLDDAEVRALVRIIERRVAQTREFDRRN